MAPQQALDRDEQRTESASSKLRSKTIKELKRLSCVDGSKSFRVVIQLGARQHWRGYGPGRWDNVGEELGKRPGEKVTRYQHRPSVNETPPISGNTVNGLIQMHNEWLEKNEAKEGLEGTMNRQLVILSITETKEPPSDVNQNLEMNAETIGKIAAASARAVVDAMLESQGKNKAQA